MFRVQAGFPRIDIFKRTRLPGNFFSTTNFFMTNTAKQSNHPDFKATERSRPDFKATSSLLQTKTPYPEWTSGEGANSDEWKKHKKISVAAYDSNRTPIDNYKLLISAITPRPVGFVSTISKSGVRNLAPFSFFNMVNVDPPTFVFGFSTNNGAFKDTPTNIIETGELTINIISEWFVEAANSASVAAPPEFDEWELSGLTPVESEEVKPPHVAESAFSVEAKYITHHEWKSKVDPSRTSGLTMIVEGVKFHIREDVVNEDLNVIDIGKLKPVSRLGGISYGRTNEIFELDRPNI